MILCSACWRCWSSALSPLEKKWTGSPGIESSTEGTCDRNQSINQSPTNQPTNRKKCPIHNIILKSFVRSRVNEIYFLFIEIDYVQLWLLYESNSETVGEIFRINPVKNDDIFHIIDQTTV